MHLTHSITYWLLTWSLLYVAIHIMPTILVNLTFRRPIRREKSLVRAGRVRTVRGNLRKPYNLGIILHLCSTEFNKCRRYPSLY